MTAPRQTLDYGLIGALTDIAFAVILAVFLSVATDWHGDAVPRPLVIAVLYGTPGVIALLGVATRRAWLLLAAALPLFPAAFLSWAGVTLVFLVPAVMLLVGATRMPTRSERRQIGLLTGLAALFVAALIFTAGWAVLIGLTASGCHSILGGQSCGDGYISLTGLFVGGACLATAIVIAAIGPGLSRLRRWRS